MKSEGRLTELPAGYATILADLKDQIRSARIKAALAVNRELVLLYWRIGRRILKQQHEEGWGSKIIDRLSLDLRREFPEMKGLSSRNLKYMRAFSESYPDEAIVQQLAAQIPWFHNCVLLDKLKHPEERIWYIRQNISQGWSRSVLVHQIESGLYERQGRALVNFDQTLPAPQSELARQILKDPYNFDFLTLGKEAQERDLEVGLLSHLQEFLLELGVGFAFVGSQYHLEVGDQDFYIDLLFYHLNLRCYVVIDLKISDFQPEYAGKMNFYLSAVDDILRHPEDEPSIGIVLCKGKNRVIAEYALRGINKPLGVAEYQLSKALPDNLKGSLPTIEELEAELEGTEGIEK
jgi:predicted nuclease of restriction endonuclease-like (RecB) superfamily